MHRIYQNDDYAKKSVVKEKPNWNIHALYIDRQLVRKKKLTKYFLPFDSFRPTANINYVLHITASSDDVKTFELRDAATLVGRDSFCDIRFLSKIVSGQHFVIQFRKVRIDENKAKPEIVPYIFDMGSKNGTYLEGKMIPRKQYVQIFDGDKITFDEDGRCGILIGVYKRKQIEQPSESEDEML